jgi:hypothetical protein
MRKTTTATPAVTITGSEATRATETAEGNATSSKEKTAMKDETTGTPTPLVQTTFAIVQKEPKDTKEASMGKTTAVTQPTATEPDPSSSNKNNVEATTAVTPPTATTESARPIARDTANVNNDPADTDMLSRLRISQDFGGKASTKKLVTTIPIRNPKKNEFVRVHPTMRPMLVRTLLDEQLTFLVTKDVADSLPGVVVAKELVPTITRQGTLFLWPLRVPGENGRVDNWLTSAKEAAVHAVHTWVRVQANMDLSAFEIYEALGAIPDPEWPQLTMDEIVRIAAKGRVIDSLDHPVIQKLRGEI